MIQKDMVKDSKYTENKELLIVSGATHTDLYDQKDIIPFDKIESFMRENMEQYKIYINKKADFK